MTFWKIILDAGREKVGSVSVDRFELPLIHSALSVTGTGIRILPVLLVKSDRLLERDFSLLELQAMAFDRNLPAHRDLEQTAKLFIKTHHESLQKINPVRLHVLCESLVQAGVSHIACDLLRKQIPKEDIWPSPLVQCYLLALENSHQLATLNTVLSEIDETFWDENIYRIAARKFELERKFDLAIEQMSLAIDLRPDSLALWHYSIYLHIRKVGKDNINSISAKMAEMPESIFEKSSDIGYQLLAQLIYINEFKRAEKHLLKWFVQNPEQEAKSFLNIAFSVSIHGIKDLPYSKELPEIGIFRGVRYSFEGQKCTQLLVGSTLNKNLYLLEHESELAKKLLTLNPQEESVFGLSDITLNEVEPPFLTAHKIALEVCLRDRSEKNIIYGFTISNDTNQAITTIENKMRRLSAADDDFLADHSFPLYFKGKQRDEFNSIKSALQLLTHEISFKPELPEFGYDTPETVIVDPYSISYLALTGLSQALFNKCKVVITHETRELVQIWLDHINNDDYFSIGLLPEGGIQKITAEDIRHQTSFIQDALKTFLSEAISLTPNTVDYPEMPLKFVEFLDLGCSSSMLLSIANDIPWLCIDPFFAGFHQHSQGISVNSKLLFAQLSQETSFEIRKRGIYSHVYTGLPFPITYSDTYQLALSSEDSDTILLSELLKKSPNVFQSTPEAVEVLHKIAVISLYHGFRDGQFKEGLRADGSPKNNGFVERVFFRCCYSVMQCKDGSSAEFKLALFLAHVRHSFYDLPKLTDIAYHLVARFILGHFLSLDEINRLLPREPANNL